MLIATIDSINAKNKIDYIDIAMKFAGITKPVIHSSDAASFGQYDISKNIFTYRN